KHPGSQSTMKQFSKLSLILIKDTGIVIACNTNGICARTTAIIISNEDIF
ncbi:unnamed protein product, partial [Rotaria sp. Silwood2]